MKIECSNCNKQYDIDNRFAGHRVKCPNCENYIEAVNDNLFPCPDCFSLISKNAVSCPKCGNPLKGKNPLVTPAAPKVIPIIPIRIDGSEGDCLIAEKQIVTHTPWAMNYLWLIILGILTAPLLFGFLILGYVWVEVRYTRYEFTNRRITLHKGMIASYHTEMMLKDICKAEFKQGIWQKIINAGDVTITAGDAVIDHSDEENVKTGEICIANIRDPKKVLKEINDLREL